MEFSRHLRMAGARSGQFAGDQSGAARHWICRPSRL